MGKSKKNSPELDANETLKQEPQVEEPTSAILDVPKEDHTEVIVAEAVAESSEESIEDTSDLQPELTPDEPQVTVAQAKEPPQAPPESKAKPKPKNWWQPALIGAGLALTLLIFVVGAFGQLYKGKVLPSVTVAGVASSSKSADQLTTQLENQAKTYTVTLQSGEKQLKPALKEIGYQVDVDKTVEQALSAKRDSPFGRFLFWQKKEVPAVVEVNSTLLAQYVETKFPSLTKNGEDAQLTYDAATAAFVISTHKDGTGPDTTRLTQELQRSADNLSPQVVKVETTKKPARITEEKLKPLLKPATEAVSRTIMLQGSTGTYQAQPADIAVWLTPTPQKDGSLRLVVDGAKVQSYVESIGKLVSSSPQDKKVIKDKKTKKEVVLQQGRDGTELADKAGLAAKITQAVEDQQNVTLQMSIKVAKAKTINLEGYDKWIEVDLSRQTTTAYEGATPVKTFVIASGLPGYDTPTGEYAIWLKVRKQTMQGGSKADGSYYNIPNVEWVSYFYQDYALHGAWWRKKFGAPASHGCVNMTNADAQWVYNWAPVGTKVIVHY